MSTGTVPGRRHRAHHAPEADGSANIDFTVAQGIAAGLWVGDSLQVAPSESATPVTARIAAIDAWVDPVTRNATVRARVSDPRHARARVGPGPAWSAPPPGCGHPGELAPQGPDGDHVFVLTPMTRASRARTSARCRPARWWATKCWC